MEQHSDARTDRATILVVEDDPSIARVTKDLLESSGHRVVVAADGNAARVAVDTEHPDLIVLDLVLPDVDGLVLCAAFKASSDALILVSSGTARKRDAILALKLGADDFVSKPFDIYEFEARVASLLRRRMRSRQQPAAATTTPSLGVLRRAATG